MYRAGWSRQEIAVAAAGYAMHGYGMWHNRARGRHTPLYARALYLQDEHGSALHFCLLDLGYVTCAMRTGIVARLRAAWGDDFADAALVLACTHTHSGPGGCTHDALYNVVTPGFVPANLAAVVDAAAAAIIAAHDSAAPTQLGLNEAAFAGAIPVAWNRSLQAYNLNPDVTPRPDTETHLAIDRAMQVLSLRRDGQLQALLSLFGVHPTCIGNTSQQYSGDNKGCAALAAEQSLRAAGAPEPVAIFAQATAGDVSPHYQGPGDIARRARLKGNAEYAYAEANGRLQTEHALAVAQATGEQRIDGAIDTVLTYVDFTALQAAPEFANGHTDAYTAEPAMGVAFFAGTRVDGPGMPAVIALVARKAAQVLRQRRLRRLAQYPPDQQTYFRRLYAAHGPKDIVLEAGRKQVLGQPLANLPLPAFADPLIAELKRQAARGAITQSALVPTVLPLQIVVIGTLALVCCPGEWTTTAGRRLVQTVAAVLQPRGVTRALLVSYCNDYMGYVTTFEEYQAQAYEGGHTIFGQWTLAAFQTRFAALAGELLRPPAQRGHDTWTRPVPPPAAELALRTDLPVPG